MRSTNPGSGHHASPLIGGLALTLIGCAAVQTPILYPNAHYLTVGRATAERDIDDCVSVAKSHGVNERRDGKVAQSAAAGAAVGGAAAGAWGLVRADDALEHAAAGAAAGAAGGAVRGAVRSSDTSELYKTFVQRCLSARGYDVVGWQ